MFTKPALQQRQNGVISVLAAVALGTAIVVAALALDLGHLFWVKRDLQKAADLASLSALTDINNPNLINATAIAQSIALTNNADLTADKVTVFTGIYNWTARTFAAGGAANQLNSVQVTVATNVAYFFVPGATPVTATAVAARRENTAYFSADSYLLDSPIGKLIASGQMDIALSIPGATLHVGELPVSNSGPARCIDPAHCDNGVVSDWAIRAHTAQVSLDLKVLGNPITIQAAMMDAALTGINCRASPRSVTIQAQTGLLTASILGISVDVPSRSSELTFTFSDTDPPPKTINVPGTGLAGLLGSIGAKLGLLDPLGLIGAALSAVGSLLDDALKLLGISLGGGDITVSKLNCYPPQLVR